MTSMLLHVIVGWKRTPPDLNQAFNTAW